MAASAVPIWCQPPKVGDYSNVQVIFYTERIAHQRSRDTMNKENDGIEVEDFFLPDLCQAQSILFLVLITEFLVFALVLATSTLTDFDWGRLGLTSLFVQWTVLVSAAALCVLRPILMQMENMSATLIGYTLILLLTGFFSVLGEFFLMGESTWQMYNTGAVMRNVLIAGIMGGIAFRYFYLQHQLRRQEQAELNSRIQALQSRIRPHFLFNSMNIIASLIAVDPDLAEQVVEDLSELFRASLNDASDHPVALAEELTLCRKYVNIESLRLGDRLHVDWQVEIDEHEVKIPMLTLQPLLENAIYHGIQPLPEGGVVTVRIGEENGKLVVRIRNPLAEQGGHETGNRMAMDNIRRRLHAIYGEAASLVADEGPDHYHTTVSYPMGPAPAAS